MADLAAAGNNLKFFDELAGRGSVIHRIHPVTKLLTTLAYIVCVVSFGKYELLPLLPLILYPVVLIILADLPPGELFKRLLLAAPFALGVGIFNPVFDRTPMLDWGGVSLTGGWLSFASIMFRFALTVLAGLVLIATSGINGVGLALLKLKLPRIFVTQLLLLYRYLNILIQEAIRTVQAYTLRSPRDKGIRFQAWGSLAGQLLLRTMDRAGRIYQAMCCRGFNGEIRLYHNQPLRLVDCFYFGCWLLFFVTVRYFDIPGLLGRVLMGVGR